MNRWPLCAALAALALCGCGEEEPEYIEEVPLSPPPIIKDYKELAKRPISELRAMLESDRVQVRRMVAVALGLKTDETDEVKATLLELTEDVNAEVASDALVAMAMQGFPETKELIRQFAESDDPERRIGACMAIGEYGDSTLYPLLRNMASSDPSGKVRRRAEVIDQQRRGSSRPVPFRRAPQEE
ncbi:MAG: HEAT repeat domain-containing protein [Candidatus Brocadiia bacterium]